MRSAAANSGSFPCKITGSALIHSIRSISLECSNGCTAQPITQAPAWGWQFANARLNGSVAGSGLNLSPDEVQRFSLPYPSGETEPERAARASHTILLIEDSAADIGLVREALEEHGVGCELIVIQDGERAIDFLKNLQEEPECPDLVILDLNLPRKPGREVLQSIRAGSKCAGVPVVVLTSSDNTQDRYDADRLGASLFLRKPSRLAEFLELGRVFKNLIENAED